MQKIQNNWTDFLDHPAQVRRLFPTNASPTLNDVRFERLLITTPKSIVLGVNFFPLVPELMKPWIEKGFASADLRLVMGDATLRFVDGVALDVQPKGNIEIGKSDLKFVCDGNLVIHVTYKWLRATFLPEIILQKIQGESDMFSSIIDS